MGNCERELDPRPPDWWQKHKFWDDFDSKWGPILRAMKELQCIPELFGELTIELPKCGPDFYIQCDFDRLIHICPFDPAWDAFEWKQKVVSERLESLEVQVKELQAKLPTGR